MIGIPVGLFTSNAFEWWLHKDVLHFLGKRRRSFWRFHWHEHHRNCRRGGNVDPHYLRSVFHWNAQGKEAALLAGVCVAIAPLFPIAPFLVGTWWYGAWDYYRKHKRAHLDPEWAREHLPWHYDHHMGPNQHANWCVTRPWFDIIMGTRVPYAGTEEEAKDLERLREAASDALARFGAEHGSPAQPEA